MEALDSTKIELLKLTHTAQGVALDATEKYYELLTTAHELEDYVDELEEDLADERNDSVEDQQYIKTLKAELAEFKKVPDIAVVQREALFFEALKLIRNQKNVIGDVDQYIDQILKISKTYGN